MSAARARSPRQAKPSGKVDEAGYARLAELRAGIRGYLAWAEQQAREHDLTPAQVQLALAVRAHPDPAGPTLTELADALLLRHHSVVGLVDRAEQAGMVERRRSSERPSHVHVRLTAAGADRLDTVSALHLEWLAEFGPRLAETCDSFTRAAR
jgi:DNA-binding MarR family transcriptional regulator